MNLRSHLLVIATFSLIGLSAMASEARPSGKTFIKEPCHDYLCAKPMSEEKLIKEPCHNYLCSQSARATTDVGNPVPGPTPVTRSATTTRGEFSRDVAR